MVSFKGRFGKSVNRKKNSLIVTLSILRSMKLINNYYDIKVNKKIPVFAGWAEAQVILQHLPSFAES